MKREGDSVAKGEVLLSIETDKSTLEVEADYSGILVKILATAETGALPCFTPIAILGEPGETVDVDQVLAKFNAK
jgi:pyruvate dehydrogenase E2 component (dihydrolipoamide acetyltransferase)